MKKFDTDYRLLAAMYRDGYFPDFLVDKIRVLERKYCRNGRVYIKMV